MALSASLFSEGKNRKRPMTPKEKEDLRGQLYARDGHDCHYCNIPEDTVLMAWKQIYGQDKRGRRLEIDRKDNSKEYSLDNCVLACAPCNIAKGSLFTYKEFEKVGKVVQKIWTRRPFIHKLTDPNMTVYRDGKVLFDVRQDDW